MAVRLFIGNLPYGASEADLRAHFSAVAEPSHVAMPVDRETGRPRGFAFVEFADRAVAEEVIRKFDSQPFQGRPLAVSEARAREDRPPRPPGGGFAPRPGGGGGFGGPRPGGPGFGGPRPPAAAASAVHGPGPGRPATRARRTRSKRQLRSAGAATPVARKENDAAGTQASRSHQGEDRRTHLRRGRSRKTIPQSRSTTSRPRPTTASRPRPTTASTIRMRNNRT